MNRRDVKIPLGMLWMILRPYDRHVDAIGAKTFFNIRLTHGKTDVMEHIEDVEDLVNCLSDPFTSQDVLNEVIDETAISMRNAGLAQNFEVVHTELVVELSTGIQEGLEPALPDIYGLDQERIVQLVVWKRWQLWLATGLN